MLNTGIIIHCNNTHDLGGVSHELSSELGYRVFQSATVADDFGLYIKCNPTVADLDVISRICYRRQVQLKVTVANKLLLVRHTQGVPVMTLLGTLHKTQRAGAMTVKVNGKEYQL